MKIFISYSSRDRWAARVILRDIESIGAEGIMNEKDIATGESIDERIGQLLQSCDHLLILLSPASNSRSAQERTRIVMAD